MMGNNDTNWGGWILTLIMLGVFWPVGLVLLFGQLMGATRRGRKHIKRHPYDLQREAQQQQNPNAGNFNANVQASRNMGHFASDTESAGKKKKDKKAKRGKKLNYSRGNTLMIVGAIIAGVFGIGLATTMGDLFYYGLGRWIFDELIPIFGFFMAGLVCLYAGAHDRKKVKRFKKYLSYIGHNTVISLSALSAAMGLRERTICEDLQDMLDMGYLPMGYIDLAAGQLVLTDEGLPNDYAQGYAPPVPEPDLEPEPEPEPEQVSRTVDEENAILQEIREVNDAIPDAEMSAKIDRIGEITGKILDYQRTHPSKSGQLRSFLNYYLPTTLKILRAYAQLDAQGIEGENISAAKKRIENMMDQVVDGFEKQLDKLFADDALDIASDVEVLENMLRKDGLSSSGRLFLDDSESESVLSGGAFSTEQARMDLRKTAIDLEKKNKKDEGGITLQL